MPSKNATKLSPQIVPKNKKASAVTTTTTATSMVWHALNEDLMTSVGVETLGIRSEELEMEVGLLAATYQDDASCTMFIGAATEREEEDVEALSSSSADPVHTSLPGHASTLPLQVLDVETEQQRDRALSENGLWSRATSTSSATGGSFVVKDCVLIQVDVALYVKAGCTTRGSIRMLISSEGYNHGNPDPTPFIHTRISIPTAEKEYECEVQGTIDTLCKDALDGQMILLPLVGAVVEAMSNVPVTSANGCWGLCMRCSQRNVRLGLPKTPGAVLEDPVLGVRGGTTTNTTSSSTGGGASTNLGRGWKCAECDSTDVVYLPSLKTVPPEEVDSTPCSFCLCEERVLIYMPCGDKCCVSCFERLCDSAIGAKEVYKPCQDEIIRTSWSAMREKGKGELGGLLPPVDYPFTPDQPSRLLKRGVTIVCPNHKGCNSGLITDLTLFKLLPIRTLSRYNAFALQHALLHEEQPVNFDTEGAAINDGLTSPYGILYATKCPLPQCHGSLHTSTQFKGLMVCPYCHGSYCHRCGVRPGECECHDVFNSIAEGFSKFPITAVTHLGLPAPSTDACSTALASRGPAASNMGVFETFFYNIPLDLKPLVIRLPQQLSRKGTTATRVLDKKITFSEVEKQFKKASVEQSLGRKFAGAGAGSGASTSPPSTVSTTTLNTLSESGGGSVDQSGVSGAEEDAQQRVSNSNFRMISSDTVLVLHWCAALIRRRTKELIKLTHTKPKWKSIRVNDPILATLQLVEKLEFDPKYELAVGSPSARDAALQECWRYIREYPFEHKQKPNQLTRPEYFRNFKSGFTEQQALMHLVRMCFRTVAVVVVFRGVSFTVHLPCDLPAHCNITSNVFLQAVSSACPLVNPRSIGQFSPATFLSDSDKAKPPSDLAPFTHLVWQLVRFLESRSGVPDDKPPAPFAVGWADILQMVTADTLLNGAVTGCMAPQTAGRWGVSPQRSLYITAGAALSTMPIRKEEEAVGNFTTALSAPVHVNLIHPGSTIYVVEHFIKDLNYSAAAVVEVEALAFAQVSNSGPTEGLTRITRKCPGCSCPTVHYLGHGCHIMECTNRRCGIQWCYACGLVASQHKCPTGCSTFCQYEVVYKKAPATEERDPATEIRVGLLVSAEDQLREGLILFSHIQGRSCSCTICPECRPHMPCSICSGCPVCTGVGVGIMAHIVEGEDDDDDDDDESDDDSDDSGSEDDSFEEGDDLLFLDDLFEM